MRLHFTVLSACVCCLACSNAISTAEDLRVDFRIEPGVVQAGDTMRATLRILNPTYQTVKLGSASGCLTMLDVLRAGDGERVDFDGTSFGCFAVISTFTIPPRDSLVHTFTLVAMQREPQSPWRYVDLPSPGVYQLRAAMQVYLPDEYVEFRVD